MTLQKGYLGGGVVVIGAVGVLLAALITTLQSATQAPWVELPRSSVPTREFRSSYPWFECTRTEDGIRGYWVYAEVNRIPADWPIVPRIWTDDPIQGYWQFVPVRGAADQSDHCFVSTDRDPIGIFRLLGIGCPTDRDWQLTPAGRRTLASLP